MKVWKKGICMLLCLFLTCTNFCDGNTFLVYARNSEASINTDHLYFDTDNSAQMKRDDSVQLIEDNETGNGIHQFNYQGTWIENPESDHYSNQKDDVCEIRFVGTYVRYYGTTAPHHGIASFSIDNGEEQQVDCYSRERKEKMLIFESEVLEYGEHVLKVRVTGEKNAASTDCYVNVDKIEVSSPSAVVNDSVIGTDELQFDYNGNWSMSEDANCYKGDNHWSNTQGDYLLFHFTGTSLKYYGTKAANIGIAGFSIDDGEEQQIDLWQENKEDQQLVYQSGALVPGAHTLKVRVAGEHNGNFVVVADRIEVYHDTSCSHENTEIRNKLEVTCEQDGYTGDTYCLDCGEKIASGKTITAQGHQWDEGVVIKEPTAEEKGEKEYTCTVCGEKRTETLPKLEQTTCQHEKTEVKNQLQASCEKAGYTGDSYCQDCGEKIASGTEIPALNHQWNEGVVTKEPTTEEIGKKEYTCTVCGEKGTEILPKLNNKICDHKKTEMRNQLQASCEQEGYTGDTYCLDCGEKLSEGEHIAALEHQWDSGKVTKEPTLTQTGVKTYTCTVCKQTRTETLAKLQPTAPKSPKKGDILKDSSSKAFYKVMTVKTVTGKVSGTLRYTKPSSKSVKNVNIPAKITISGGTFTVTSVGEKAFLNHKKLEKVVIGSNVTSIGTSAFSGCSKLKNVTIGKKVTTIGTKAFNKCTSLAKLTIPSKVKKIGSQAFSGCKKLKNITIKTTKLTKKSVGANAFKGIFSKAVIKVPKSKLKSYQSILKARGVGKKVKVTL